MTDTETMNALREWKRARSALLAGIAQHETWMKTKGKGADVIDPTPLMDLWREVSTAEARLMKAQT